ANPALVHDYRSANLNVYLKDIAFTPAGHPVLLYLTSKGFEPGPKSAPFQWHTARWTGREWTFRPFTTSDHNYDHGSLYIQTDGTWRVIAPPAPGPQSWGTGGGMVMLESRDEGTTSTIATTLADKEGYKHTHARKPGDADLGFYALWADGSRLE